MVNLKMKFALIILAAVCYDCVDGGAPKKKGQGGPPPGMKVNPKKPAAEPASGSEPATTTHKPGFSLFGPMTPHVPRWLKDDLSRAGKINMRPLDGTPHTILRKRLSWLQGDIACHKLLGTQMAVLETPEKADKLIQAIFEISVWNLTKEDFMFVNEKYEYGLNRRYWIGANDLVGWDGIYEWKINDDSVTDRILLTYGEYFQTAQPDHRATDVSIVAGKRKFVKHPREHCLGLWNPTFYRSERHSFNDEPCTNRYYVICDNPDSGPPNVPPVPKQE